MTEKFHPVLPFPWRVVFGQDGVDPWDPQAAIELTDDLRWDEDIYVAEKTNAPDGWDWAIWLDGGRDIAVWQCTLVRQRDRDAPIYMMRDFLSTTAQVQLWMDRAVRVQKIVDRSCGEGEIVVGEE